MFLEPEFAEDSLYLRNNQLNLSWYMSFFICIFVSANFEILVKLIQSDKLSDMLVYYTGCNSIASV